MADEPVPPSDAPPAPDPAAVERAAAEARRAADDARIEQLTKSVAALKDTVSAALQPRPVQTASGKLEVPANMRTILRQGGLTDADIELNAPLILPFLAALEATSGAQFQFQLQQVNDEIAMVKASRNSKKYPDWATVGEAVADLRDQAAKEGRYLSVDAAYHAAVASNLDRVAEARAALKARAQERNADLAANQFVDHGEGVNRQARATRPTSADDLKSMSREDRKKFFDSMGDTPIR